MPEPVNHASVVVRLLERAEYIANADKWYGDRDADVANQSLQALVHATLEVAEMVARLVDGLPEWIGRSRP